MLTSYLNLKSIFGGLLTFIFALSAQASVVAIIDSGTDMEHIDIAPKAWWNPVDIPGTGRDEDGNGYPDDTHGWNFAEGNNEVIDYSYLDVFDEDIRKFFDIQTLMMLGDASQEQLNWLREKIEDEEFVQRLQVYGNFMHGTHVGGIAIEGADHAELLAVKLIPTEVDLPFFTENFLKEQSNKQSGQIEDLIRIIRDMDTDDLANLDEEGFRVGLVKRALGLLASEQSKLLIEIGEYVDGHEVDIANGSFGTGYAQAEMIVKMIFEGIFRREPTGEETYEMAAHFINTLVEHVSEMAEIAPETLYVFAAGNDGTDNDEFPVSPSNIDRDNVISVAATYDRVALAPFSNYGLRTVDVAAPGLGITNAAPGDEYLTVSGTSQAAPYVARVAAELKDLNEGLSPLEIRQIIEGTVDVKDFLVGKVTTSGIVNGERAKKAAKLSLSMPISDAVAESHQIIDDMAPSIDSKDLLGAPLHYMEGLVAPLPSPIKVQ